MPKSIVIFDEIARADVPNMPIAMRNERDLSTANAPANLHFTRSFAVEHNTRHLITMAGTSQKMSLTPSMRI